MNPHLQRAFLLLEQSRFELAEQELRQALTANPDDATTHAVLAICLAEGKQFQEGTEAAQNAIHLAPDEPFSHYAHSIVLRARNRIAEAEEAIRQAIGIDPSQPQFFAQLAALFFDQKQWQQAVDAAEHGLQIDPENVQCTNLRAMALVKLGRKGQAGESIATALKRNPEDAFSHANMGWVLIEQGDFDKAMEHFREALRLEPEMAWARAGIVEAMKGRYFIYRIMLGYFLWMTKLTSQMQWGVVIGGYLGFQFLRSLAANNPDLAPWITPILVAYIAFAIMTWVSMPLFNLLLRLNRFGRLALSREQIITSNFVGICVLGALGSLLGYFALGTELFLPCALVFGLMIPPVSVVYACDKGWPRNWMLLITIGLAVLGSLTIAGMLGAMFLARDLGTVLVNLSGKTLLAFVLGAVASQFAANGLVQASPKH